MQEEDHPLRKMLYTFCLLSLLVAISLTGCTKEARQGMKTEQPSDGQLIVGFSQMNHINPWRVAETNDLKREAEKRGAILLLNDAKSSIAQQTIDIRSFIEQGADYIVCTPFVYEGYDEIVELCKQANIPLIMLDREIRGEGGVDFLTFIGSDFYEEGVRAARWLAHEMDNTAKIVELKGNDGSSCSTDRKNGFASVIDTIEGMEIVVSQFADFERIKGQDVMEGIILSYGKDFNAVYAHSDEMAIGAIQALKAANIVPNKDVKIVSIDGSRDAFKSIIAGELGATVECTPRLANVVFNTIEAHQRGEAIPPKILMEDRLFDSSNALELFNEGF
ncbi:MAG: sugar ABC transporter substrate-binding protein [Bacteroidia bacterium]|nr:sugar ABC transporter substrate-binding protein [Bacteroidia bacterium]